MATGEEPRVFLAWCYEVAPGQMALLTKAEVESRGLRPGQEIEARIVALTDELQQLRGSYERGLREGAAWPAAALTKADQIAREREQT